MYLTLISLQFAQEQASWGTQWRLSTNEEYENVDRNLYWAHVSEGAFIRVQTHIILIQDMSTCCFRKPSCSNDLHTHHDFRSVLCSHLIVHAKVHFQMRKDLKKSILVFREFFHLIVFANLRNWICLTRVWTPFYIRLTRLHFCYLIAANVKMSLANYSPLF